MQTDWILEQGFWSLRFYDLPNLLICLLYILYCSKAYRVPQAYTYALLLHCFLPLLLNGVLFSFSYMPDALKYWRTFGEIRSGNLGILEAWSSGGNVERASVMFAVMPFPFAITPLSLGFFNTFLYAALFFWLYRRGVLTIVSTWFYLLYPSLALYVGMGLRDTFILVFMILAIQFAREARWIAAVAPLGLLYAIKFQNFYILTSVLLIFLFLGIRTVGVTLGRGIFIFSLGVAALVISAPLLLPLINTFRLAMYLEDGGDPANLVAIETPLQFLFQGTYSGLYFLLKPFPWEVENVFQAIQSVENVAVVIILLLISRAAFYHAPKRLVFWVFFLLFSFTIYGLIVFNYGTAARYRYPFIAIYVIFVCADCGVHRLFRSLRPSGSLNTRLASGKA